MRGIGLLNSSAIFGQGLGLRSLILNLISLQASQSTSLIYRLISLLLQRRKDVGNDFTERYV